MSIFKNLRFFKNVIFQKFQKFVFFFKNSQFSNFCKISYPPTKSSKKWSKI